MLAILACLPFGSGALSEEGPRLPGFYRSPQMPELTRWLHDETGVRTYLNAPLEHTGRTSSLILYATPNGNSIEQTLGCRLRMSAEPGRERDWHFDIQHVAAQVRAFRQIDPSRTWLLAVTDCSQRSWPSFRQSEPSANRKIQQQVDHLMKLVDADQFVLSGHSGGGSFIFGYIESVDALPPSLQQILLLDANYAYDDALHAKKLLTWLLGDRQRHLVVIAYDDREITLHGKKVVGPTGGTFRATARMVDRFGQDVELHERQEGPFRHVQGMDGQIQIFVHQNPENKILHTALVGEMNGFMEGLAMGRRGASSDTDLSGPRAYERWIQDAPEMDPLTPDPGRFRLPFVLTIPPRPAGAITGSQLADKIQQLPRDAREQVILRELRLGNVPDRLRQVKAIHTTARDHDGRQHWGTCFVTPDYVAVGSNEDFLRVPLTPQTARQVALAWKASLITTKISDAVFAAAELRLTPQPLSDNRESIGTFVQHQKLIEAQWNGASPFQLVAGIKKDVVMTDRLRPGDRRVAIYGWHRPDGSPIQPLYLKHLDTYVDYSHGVRLMADSMWVDGMRASVADIFLDPELRGLLCDENRRRVR